MSAGTNRGLHSQVEGWARCLALVVASPALVRAHANTPRQMQLANALCRLAEVSGPRTATVEPRPPHASAVSQDGAVPAWTEMTGQEVSS